MRDRRQCHRRHSRVTHAAAAVGAAEAVNRMDAVGAADMEGTIGAAATAGIGKDTLHT